MSKMANINQAQIEAVKARIKEKERQEERRKRRGWTHEQLHEEEIKELNAWLDSLRLSEAVMSPTDALIANLEEKK